MEEVVEKGANHRRLFLTALSVLTQVLSRRTPCADDIRFLRANALADEVDLDLDELAGSIVRRETNFRAAERKLA